jgi:hypothetical protein
MAPIPIIGSASGTASYELTERDKSAQSTPHAGFVGA